MTEAEQERAAVVAWLRHEGKLYCTGSVNNTETAKVVGATLKVFARAIERGEHIEAQAHLSEGSD